MGLTPERGWEGGELLANAIGAQLRENTAFPPQTVPFDLEQLAAALHAKQMAECGTPFVLEPVPPAATSWAP